MPESRKTVSRPFVLHMFVATEADAASIGDIFDLEGRPRSATYASQTRWSTSQDPIFDGECRDWLTAGTSRPLPARTLRSRGEYPYSARKARLKLDGSEKQKS